MKNISSLPTKENEVPETNRSDEGIEKLEEEKQEQQLDESNKAELLLLNSPLSFETITPDNAKVIFELFTTLSPLLAQIITPGEALRDPIAQSQTSPEYQTIDLYEERVYSRHLFFQTVRWIFSQNQFPDFNSAQNPKEIQDKLNNYLYSLGDWSQLWIAFKKYIITQCPEGQFIVEYFEAFERFFARDWLKLLTIEECQRHDELYKLLFKDKKKIAFNDTTSNKLKKEFFAIEEKVESAKRQSEAEMQQSLVKLEKWFMTTKEKEHGRKFANSTEQRLYESSLHLQKQLSYLNTLTSRQVREELARRAHTEAFCYSVLMAIKQSPLTNHETIPILQLFNKMLNDFISIDPESLWPFSGNFNFLHDIFHFPDAQTILNSDTPTKYFADMIVDQLENLLDNLQAIFKKKEGLTNTQKYLQQSLHLHCEERLIALFLSDVPYSYAYGNEQQKLAFKFSFKGYGYIQNDPLVKDIQERYQKLQDFRNWGTDWYEDMLKNIHIFPFTVLRKIYTGNDISQQIYNTSTEHYKNLYRILLPTLEASIHLQIETLLQPLKDLVKGLIEQRTTNGAFSEVLGIGFSGPLFAQTNFANTKKNTIYLTFSRTGCTEWHYYLLTLLRSHLYQTESIYKGIKIKIVSEQGIAFTYKKKESIAELTDIQSDHAVYAYILDRILRRTLSITSDIHPDLKEIWLIIILDIIKDSKNKELSNLEKERLISCVKEAKISYEDYEKIKQHVLSDQHYGCAESLISKYGSTNKYIPIIFLPKHKDQAKLNGEPVNAGNHKDRQRLIISPCYRCRLLSAPYLLWSVLYKGWGLGDLNLAAKRRGQRPIQPRFFRTPATNNQQLIISDTNVPNGKLDELPREIQMEIFKYFTPAEQMQLSIVSKRWRQALCSQTLWNQNWFSQFSQTEYLKQKNIGNYRRRFFIIKNRLEIVVEKVYRLLKQEISADKDYFTIYDDILNNLEMLIKDIKINFCELIYHFLKKHPEVNHPYALGYTLLHLAVALGEFEAVKYLITAWNADVNVGNCRGYSPLAIAIDSCPDLTIKLSQHKNLYSDTSLYSKFIKIIKFLIANDADTNKINTLDDEEEYNTAIGYARARLKNNEALIEVIDTAILERTSLLEDHSLHCLRS